MCGLTLSAYGPVYKGTDWGGHHFSFEFSFSSLSQESYYIIYRNQHIFYLYSPHLNLLKSSKMTEVISPQQQPHTTKNEPTNLKPETENKPQDKPKEEIDEANEASKKLSISLAEIIEKALDKLDPILKMVNEVCALLLCHFLV